MHIQSLFVSDFRNWALAELSLGPHFNYIYGTNGAGKTALLEAVTTLSRARSFRAGSPSNLIRHGNDAFLLRSELSSGAQLGIHRTRGGVVQIRRNGEAVKRVSELARELPIHVLLPDSSELIFSGPSLRRRFLDWGLFHVEHAYLKDMRSFQKLLQQRNAWLKDTSATDLENDPWAKQFAELAANISLRRHDYVIRLQDALGEILERLNDDLDFSIDYDVDGFRSAGEIYKKLEENFARDVKMGSSQVGPHRADLKCRQAGKDAAKVASRGQAKVMASALILAQAKYERERLDRPSVILIDDFGAELDKAHWGKFLALLVDLGCQVIATSTEAPEDHPAWDNTLACDVFHVEQGKIRHIRSP